MADYTPSCFTPAAASAFAVRDTGRITGKIAKVLAYRSPWINTLKGGTFENNIGDTVTSVTQEQAFPGVSLANPTFAASVTTCAPQNNEAQVGAQSFTYSLETLRGTGPRVCAKGARGAFKSAYQAAGEALQESIVQVVNADIRYQMYLKSGLKFVCNASGSFSQLVNGGIGQIAVTFAPGYTPNAQLNVKVVTFLCRKLREELIAPMYEAGKADREHFKLVTDADTAESLRTEVGTAADLKAFVTGQYKLGAESVAGYTWSGPYKGFAIGIDPLGLRPSVFNAGAGTVTSFHEPLVAVNTSTGVAGRPNPAYWAEQKRISFLIAEGSFQRHTPARYSGEGIFKATPQLAMGELQWFQPKDTCNPYGDVGWHIYEIERAIVPIRPWFVVPIAHLGCTPTTDLVACSTLGSGL